MKGKRRKTRVFCVCVLVEFRVFYEKLFFFCVLVGFRRK